MLLTRTGRHLALLLVADGDGGLVLFKRESAKHDDRGRGRGVCASHFLLNHQVCSLRAPAGGEEAWEGGARVQ